MSKKIVLLIDDEADIIEVLKIRFTESGFEVESALDGQEGLNKVEEEKPDIIVLDVLMPVVDGFEFFKKIKQKEETRNIPVLVLTARGTMKDTFDALDADGFMPKPFKSEELIAKVKELTQDRALILGDNSQMVREVTGAMEKEGFEVSVFEDIEQMRAEASKERYSIIIVHLGMVKKDPADFMKDLNVKVFKHKDPVVIVYGDSTVEGVGDYYTDEIDRIKEEWHKLDVDTYFDVGGMGRPFAARIHDWKEGRKKADEE